MTSAPSPSRRPRHAWARLNDEQLLEHRFCDLKLDVRGTVLEERVERLYGELERKGITFRPHVWLSTEWFTPDGVPGIAMPFFLAHPRLLRLERRQMLSAEGASEAKCMRILRHEAGHCIDNAFRLHRRKRWRELFGPFTTPYPRYYKPRPRSRRYVMHLENWYAQAHPAEDFAETFAVWLQPNSRWRQAYAHWPALRKLEYVDELMGEIAGQTPPVRTRRRVEPLSQIRRTLRAYYRRKKMHYAAEFPEFYDRDLFKIFSADADYRHRPTAASFLNQIRVEVRETVAHWTNSPPYTIDQVLRDMIDRCKELRLRLALPQRQAKQQAMMMITVQTMNFLHSGRYRVPL